MVTTTNWCFSAHGEDPIVHLFPNFRLHCIPEKFYQTWNFFILMTLSIFLYLLPLWSSLKWSPFHLLLTCALASGLVYTKEAIMLGTSNPMLM